MDESDQGENIEDQFAADSTGDTDQSATGQEGVTGAQTAPEQKTVPYDRFKEVNDAKKAAEQDAANLRAQFDLMQHQSVQQMPQQAKDFFAAQGLSDDDWPTVAQIRDYAATIERRTAAAQQVSARDQFIRSKSDYAELVGKEDYAGRFVPSETFAKVLAADPELQLELGNPATAPRIAYRAAKNYVAEQELGQLKGKAKQEDIDFTVDVKTRPGSPASVGGAAKVGASINAGLDPNDPDDRRRIRANFKRMLEGDFDT